MIEYVILFSKLSDAIQAPHPVARLGVQNEESNHDEYSLQSGNASNGKGKVVNYKRMTLIISRREHRSFRCLRKLLQIRTGL